MREQRRFKRFVVEYLDIHARTVSAVDVDIINISLGGISVSSPKRLNIGGTYSLKLYGIDGTMSVQAEVVWEKLSGSRKEEDTSVPIYTAGLCFCDAMSPKMQRIKEYIEGLDTEVKHRLTGVRFRIKSGERATVHVPNSYTVKKLSLGGMLIETDAGIDVDITMPMEIVLPGSDVALDFSGRVASCLELKANATQSFDIGVEFVRMTEGDKFRLAGFIKKLETAT